MRDVERDDRDRQSKLRDIKIDRKGTIFSGINIIVNRYQRNITLSIL